MDLLKVTSSPHMRHEDSTSIIMLDVIISLIPALIWGTYIFGTRALLMCAVSCASSVVFEFLYRKIMKKNCTISDLSAVVTGLLLAFTMPVSAPLWMPVIGTFFAIVIVKQLYGGIGKNFVNPALAARVFLFIAFPSEMSTFVKPRTVLSGFSSVHTDAIASATPLESIKDGILPSYNKFECFIGNIPGCIGEVSVLLLFAGALYLFVRRIISWQIPFSYILTVAIISYLFTPSGFDHIEYTIYQICTGGLVLGAFFMATDYSSSPLTNTGRIIYGVGCGLITMFIRRFGGYPEGVSFAILIMNCLVLPIDKWTKPTAFGKKTTIPAGGNNSNEKK